MANEPAILNETPPPTPMTMAGAAHPDLAMGTAEIPDVVGEVRWGFSPRDSKSPIAYEDMLKVRSQRGGEVKRYCCFYRAPNKKGEPGQGDVWALEAQKDMKHRAKGYRPLSREGLRDGHTLWEAGPPPPPARWSASMIQDAVQKGQPIPQSMAPKGYFGPTFVQDMPDPLTLGADGLLRDADGNVSDLAAVPVGTNPNPASANGASEEAPKEEPPPPGSVAQHTRIAFYQDEIARLEEEGVKGPLLNQTRKKLRDLVEADAD